MSGKRNAIIRCYDYLLEAQTKQKAESLSGVLQVSVRCLTGKLQVSLWCATQGKSYIELEVVPGESLQPLSHIRHEITPCCDLMLFCD